MAFGLNEAQAPQQRKKRPDIAISGLKALPEEERPRERMLRDGIDALSVAELIAIVLGSGTRGKSVLNGVETNLNQGDIVHIPATLPHQLLLPKGGTFLYFVIKVKEK